MRLEIISRQPETKSHSTPLLFVHGSWHGAWCWEEHFLDYFAMHGYAAHAVSLRGHGSSDGRKHLRWWRIADYVADVEQACAQLPNPPVLIGHSAGGLVVQKYLETHSAPAGVLLSSIPPRGIVGTALRFAFHHPIQFLKVNALVSQYPVIGTLPLARSLLFSADMPIDKAKAYFECLQDDSTLAFFDMMILNRPRPYRINTPLLVIGGRNDAAVLPDEVQATARTYHTEAVILPGIAHDMMLETAWQTAADRIIDWLDEKRL